MLSRIPKDVLFLIFNQLELMTFQEEEMELHQLIHPKEGLPVPHFEEDLDENIKFEDWDEDDL